MHILFVTPRLPYPPNRGDKVRPWNLAKSLATEHTLSLVSLIQGEEEREHADALSKVFQTVEMVLLKPRQSYRNMLLNLVSPTPLQVHYFRSRQMQSSVGRFLAESRVDVIYAFHLRSAPYVARANSAYRILDLTDSVSMFLGRRARHAPWYLKPVLANERSRVHRFEQEISRHFDETWLISTMDRDAIWPEPAPGTVRIVPNGIDAEYFRPSQARHDSRIISFVGYMGAESVDAVRWFHRDILPPVKARVPDAEFYVVGADPPPQIRALGRGDGVTVTGYVEDLRSYYDQTAVAIAPMRFVAGMQNKILEAMAMEVPVVTTTGGNEGINAADGEQICVADQPADFADKVVRLLSDEGLRRSMGKKARQFVTSRFSWDVAAERMREIERTLGTPAGRSARRSSGLSGSNPTSRSWAPPCCHP